MNINCRLSYIVLMLAGIFTTSCGSDKQQQANENKDSNAVANLFNDSITPTGSTDKKGIGKFKDVKLTHPLDQSMITKDRKSSV